MADTTFSNGTVIEAAWLNDVNNFLYKGTISPSFTWAYSVNDFMTNGVIPTGGVTQRSFQNLFGDIISVKSFGAVGDGVANDTSAIIAANAYAIANKKKVFFPGGNYRYVPTTYLETAMWIGDGSENSLVYVDCTSYTGVVFRLTKNSEWRDIQIRETNLSKTNGILVQLSDTTATNVAGGANTFTAYTNLHRVWVFGGATALDVGNMFTCKFDSCMFRQAGIGVRIVPTDDAGDNGYANTLTFINCEISENNQNWSVNGVGSQIKGLLVLGGSTERCLTTTSSFTNLLGARFVQHYIEQSAAVTTMTFNGCTGLMLNLVPVGANCNVSLGTNTEVTIENWNNGASYILGGDGTQNVTVRNCVFASSGNSPVYNFNKFYAYASSYNGIVYDNYAPSLESLESNKFTKQTTVVTTAGANDVFLFRDGKSGVQNNGVSGFLNINAYDTSTSANYASYTYAIMSCNNGATNATLTQLGRVTRGTDVGTSTTPFSLAADGASGAVKVQFTKNAAIASVTTKVQFVGNIT